MPATAALALAVLLVEGPAGAAGNIAMPGDPEYWVKLSALRPNAGRLDPSFDPNEESFELRVDAGERNLTLTIVPDLSKYNPQFCPTIEVDGKPLHFSPLDQLTYDVELDQDIGPVDRTLRIRLSDPSGPHGFGPLAQTKAHEYAVRILQAPEFQRVMALQDLSVVGPGGSELPPSPRWVRGSADHELTYVLPDAQGDVKIKAVCSKHATALRIDGHLVDGHDAYEVPAVHSGSKVVVQCEYKDEMWAPVALFQAYTLGFRTSLDFSHIGLSLGLSQRDGYCAMRGVEVGGGGEAEMQRGFVCRSVVATPHWMAMFHTAGAKVVLHTESGQSYPMRAGLQTQVPIPGHEAKFTLEVQGGQRPIKHPVEVFRVAQCSTMQCPANMSPRPGQDALAQRGHICFGLTCGERDVQHCCEENARCTALTACPAGQLFRTDAANLFCSGLECSEASDAATCCGQAESCDKAARFCDTLRTNAAHLFCPGKACTEQDAERCCSVTKAEAERAKAAKEAKEAEALKEAGRAKAAKEAKEAEALKEAERAKAKAAREAQEAEALKEAERAKAAREEGESAEAKAAREAERAAEAKRRAEEELEAAKNAAFARYARVGCFPAPLKICRGQACFFDPTCEDTPPRLGGLGCYAAGLDGRCRFCGFGIYPACPETPPCGGDVCSLPYESQAWCGKMYSIKCVSAMMYAESSGWLFGASSGGGAVTAGAAIGVALAAALVVRSRLPTSALAALRSPRSATSRTLEFHAMVESVEDAMKVPMRYVAEGSELAESGASMD